MIYYIEHFCKEFVCHLMNYRFFRHPGCEQYMIKVPVDDSFYIYIDKDDLA